MNFSATVEQDLPELLNNAAEDYHPVVLPNYTLRKEGRIVGYVSIVPTAHAWIDTQRVTAFDTFRRVFPFTEEQIRARGFKHMFYVTGKQSNLTPFASRIGYDRIGSTELFSKRL